MTTLDHDLDRLREGLRLAIAADLRRGARRRRRAAQLALAPALALTAGGVAVAVVPGLSEPAPPRVQGEFDHILETSPAPGGHSRWLPEKGSKLSLWARDGDLALYGHLSASGTVCTLADRGEPTGAGCRSDWRPPGPDAIELTGLGGATHRLGGATHREANFVTGQVGAPDVVNVEISAAGIPDVTQVPVGHEGWFIAQLPDSTLGSPDATASPPQLSVVARDASGAVVARYPADAVSRRSMQGKRPRSRNARRPGTPR